MKMVLELFQMQYNREKVVMSNRKSRLNWTQQEDNVIKCLHEEDQLASWKRISKELLKRSPNRKRTPKQCRERYMNCLRFGNQFQQALEWTSIQQAKLFENVLIYGPRWVKIAQLLPGRSENCIKNKFYGSLRKTIRKMNKVEKEEGNKLRKSIKYQSLLKFLEISNVEKEKEYIDKFGKKLSFFREIKAQLFELTLDHEQNNSAKFLSLSQKLHQFNSTTRYTVCNRRKTKAIIKEESISVSEFDSKQNTVMEKKMQITEGTCSEQKQQSKLELIEFDELNINIDNEVQLGLEPENLYLMNIMGTFEEWKNVEDLLDEKIDPFQLLF